MVSLSKNQVCLIEEDVEKARLTLTHLSDELIDHICCEVENKMSNGISFDDAYEQIKQQTGIKVLQKIQESTLYLIDKNYRLMKTTMKIAGNVSLAMIGLGTVSKIFHWPGASILLLLGFVLLCFLFFPAAIYLNYREAEEKQKLFLNISVLLGGILLMIGVLFKVMHWPGASALLQSGWFIVIALFLPTLLVVKLKVATSTKEKIAYVLGVIALMLFELSTMFKMMHWPGASVLLIVGSVLLVSVFIPMYTNIQFKKTGKITGQYIFVIILSMYAVAMNSLLSMNVSTNILARFEQDEINLSAINSYFDKKKSSRNNVVLTDSLTKKQSTEILAVTLQAAKVDSAILAIKLLLIQQVEGVDKEVALSFVNNPSLLSKPDNYDVVNHLSFGAEGGGFAPKLKAELDTFKECALKASTSNSELTKNITTLINTANTDSGNGPLTWEEVTFRNNMIISTLNTLSYINRNVKQIENDLYTQTNN